MKKHDIALNILESKGNIASKIDNSLMYITNTKRLSTKFENVNMDLNSYVLIPNKFKLPLRIDIAARIDSPGLYLLLGSGHINFGTDWSDNRRIDDIVEPKCHGLIDLTMRTSDFECVRKFINTYNDLIKSI